MVGYLASELRKVKLMMVQVVWSSRLLPLFARRKKPHPNRPQNRWQPTNLIEQMLECERCSRS